ncbi:MAG: M20/M25/M40 family metallo-hydrolase [Ardenticatenaceae bacterium]|nr:M20/M25/M40 family metallo-hydrolase [Ardenticatenaceae bacterium]
MARRPPETEWRFMLNIRPRPWTTRNRREVHDLDHERSECELDEDFRLGNLRYVRIENTLDALVAWLDNNPSYNPCPVCVQLPDYDNNIIEPDDQRVLLYVDRKRLIDLLFDMVAIPSPTFEEGPLATYLADVMAAMGLQVELQPVEDAPGSGRRSQQPIGRWPGREDGPTILLASHMDHEPPAEGWDRPPFQGHAGRGWVYGCGVQDGKGGIATMIAAILALKNAGLSLQGNVVLAPLVGHKRASRGMQTLLESGLRPDWTVDVQNTDLSIVNLAVGALPVRISTTAHPRPFRSTQGADSRPPDPVAQMAQIVQALGPSRVPIKPGGWLNFAPHAALPGFPQLNIDAIEGDSRRCWLDFHVRTVPGQDEETMLNDLERLLNQVGAVEPGLNVTAQVPSPDGLTIPPLVGREDTALVRTLRKWHKRLVRRRPIIGAGAFLGEVGDGHLAAQARIPTVLYGPGDRSIFEQWPTPNERIWIEDMSVAAGTIALTVRDLLGHEPSSARHAHSA